MVDHGLVYPVALGVEMDVLDRKNMGIHQERNPNKLLRVGGVEAV